MALALTLGAVASVLLGFIFATAYESDDIKPNSLTSWLLIPDALRQIEPVGQCAPLRHSRSFQECGGICGEYVGVNFGTTLSEQDLREAYPLTPYLAATGFEEGRIFLAAPVAGAPDNCARAFIELYDDFTRSER